MLFVEYLQHPVNRLILFNFQTTDEFMVHLFSYPKTVLLEDLLKKIVMEDQGFYLCKKDTGYSYFGFKPQAFFESPKKDSVPFLDLMFKEYSSLDSRRDKINPDIFCGGLVGFLSYDLGKHIDHIPSRAPDDLLMPDYAFGVYENVIIFDHLHGKLFISYRNKKELKDVISWLEAPLPHVFSGNEASFSRPSANMTFQEYCRAIDKIKNYLYNGEIYQLNFAQRFSFEATDFEHSHYVSKLLLEPHSSFFRFSDFEIYSFSPERFLKVDLDRNILTQPIKGTVRRGSTRNEEENLKKALLSSDKDRAEHIMIVDLERNDLGKICIPGSIHVPSLFEVCTYEKVHHLVSTVQGRLRKDINLMDIILATFPGGSITGAPKKRAQEIIEELEPVRRGIYTGSIGFIDFRGHFDLNIAIRTLIKKGRQSFFSVGGGIVIDSDPQKEFEETLVKGEMIVDNLSVVSF